MKNDSRSSGGVGAVDAHCTYNDKEDPVRQRFLLHSDRKFLLWMRAQLTVDQVLVAVSTSIQPFANSQRSISVFVCYIQARYLPMQSRVFQGLTTALHGLISR